MGILAWPPYDLATLAIEEQLVDPERYRLVRFQTPSELVRSFRYGLLDVIFITSHFAVSTLNEIGDTRIIYVIDVSLGGDALLARPGIESAADLRGATIGVEVAPLGMYTLVRALDGLGLQRDEVEIVNVDTADQFDAWDDEDIDAVVTYEPTRSRLLERGAVELFNSQSIPYEILDVVVAKQGTIEVHGPALVEFVRGMDRALSVYRSAPETSVPVMARRHAISEADFVRAMAGVQLFDLSDNVELLKDGNGRLLGALHRQCEVMAESGMLNSIPELESMIEPAIVERASGR